MYPFQKLDQFLVFAWGQWFLLDAPDNCRLDWLNPDSYNVVCAFEKTGTIIRGSLSVGVAPQEQADALARVPAAQQLSPQMGGGLNSPHLCIHHPEVRGSCRIISQGTNLTSPPQHTQEPAYYWIAFLPPDLKLIPCLPVTSDSYSTFLLSVRRHGEHY